MAQPFSPEPFDVLQGRYEAAVAEIYDHSRIAAGQQIGPSGKREHVFDFADGLRLIVSRDRTTDGRTGVFVSGSVRPGTAIYAALRRARGDPREAFCAAISGRWQELAGSSRTPELQGWSAGKGVPHFVVWDVQ